MILLFPNIDIFGFTIAYYGIIIGAAILLGFLIATVEAKRTGQNPEDYMDMGIIGVIAGIVGARLYYVIFSWDMYKDNLLHIFNLREGGLAIYGGVIGAVIAVFALARWKKLSPFLILDTVAMPILNGQMLGRWGNFFKYGRTLCHAAACGCGAFRRYNGADARTYGNDRRCGIHSGQPDIPL